MIPQLVLVGPDADQLYLFTLLKHPEGAYIEADAYVAQRSRPTGTVYTVQSGQKTVHIRTEQPLSEGAHFYPGDPKHFGRLSERPLFLQLEVTDGSP